MKNSVLLAATVLLWAQAGVAQKLSLDRPSATIDLKSREGASLVEGVWRFSDVEIVESRFPSAGPDGQPTGALHTTYDISPRAGAADFDDAAWQELDPESLELRRSGGQVCFAWFRINVTIPEKVGDTVVDGATVVLHVRVDDYAEVWVNGSLPKKLGQSGGSMVSGWNAPNRLVVAADAQPGQQIQLAIFGINGPISEVPSNYIWIREARLEFYNLPRAVAPQSVPFELTRFDSAIDEIVARGATVEKVAAGFDFTEGPVWIREGAYLLFSDPNANRIYKWHPSGQLSVFRENSGYAGADVAEYRQPGSNGLAVDNGGRLTICQHRKHP